MAEPIGLAASIVGLATLVYKVAETAHEIYGEASNADSEIQQFLTELTSLGEILAPLQDGQNKLEGVPDLTNINGLISTCTAELQLLHGKLQREPGKTGGFQKLLGGSVLRTRIKWPWSAKETRKCIDTIERLKTSIILALHV